MRRLSLLGIMWVFSCILNAQVHFTDLSIDSGIAVEGQMRGISVGDYDNDGWEDLIFTGLNGATTLLRNEGDMTFSDQTALLGLLGSESFGAAIWADLDNDGDEDLVLAGRFHASRLYRNEGDGTFVNATAGSGITEDGFVLSLNAADVDMDGQLDLYFAALNGTNSFYRSNGDLTFTNETLERNMDDPQLSMGAIFTDYNQDGAIDLYLTHDGDQPNILLKNDGNGYFSDVSQATATDFAANGMGVDAADLDGDGWLDFYITNLYPNALLRNLEGNFFLDRSFASGTDDVGMGWGLVCMDVNLDGLMDIYVGNETNFEVAGQRYNNILYLNEGNMSFVEADPEGVWASDKGTYGVASADFDLDGDLDLVLANSSTGCELFRNDTETTGHWLQLELEGVESSRSAAGARVILSSGAQQWVDELHLGAGFASQSSQVLHFGLGDAATIDELLVFWPSGHIDSLSDFSTNQTYTLVEGEGLVSGVSEVAKQAEFVWPNPVYDHFQIELPDNEAEESGVLVWWSIDGRMLASQRIRGPRMELTVPRQISGGMYIVELRSAGLPWQQRLLVAGGN